MDERILSTAVLFSAIALSDLAHAAYPTGLPIVASIRIACVAVGNVDYVSMDAPRPDWLDDGAEIQSAASFEENLRSVVARAHAHGDPMLLLTFATHLPGDYSLQAFHERRLDYTLHLTPIEMWGTPQNVLAAVTRHNEIVSAPRDAR